MVKPTWGKKASAHVKQGELVIDSIGNLCLSIQKLIFALKKLWFSLGGLSAIYFLDSKVDWSVISGLIK